MIKNMDRDESLAIVVCAELAIGLFLERVAQSPDRPGGAYDLLVERDASGDFTLLRSLEDKFSDREKVEPLVGRFEEYVLDCLERFGEALEELITSNELRMKADQIVHDKFQVFALSQCFEPFVGCKTHHTRHTTHTMTTSDM